MVIKSLICYIYSYLKIVEITYFQNHNKIDRLTSLSHLKFITLYTPINVRFSNYMCRGWPWPSSSVLGWDTTPLHSFEIFRFNWLQDKILSPHTRLFFVFLFACALSLYVYLSSVVFFPLSASSLISSHPKLVEASS